MKIAELYTEVKADTSQFNRKVGNVRNSLQSLNRGLQASANFARKFLLVQGLVAGASLRLFAQAEGIGSQFDVVFGQYAKSADRWANQLASSVGRFSNDIKSYMATLQDTFVPLGFARKEAMEMSKQLTKLGIDLGSFKNIADERVFSNLTSALVGNHEAARIFGVVITQASLAQELLNMGIEDGIQKASSMQKVQARLNLIMRGTTDAQGDAVKTIGELSNQYKKFMGQIKQLAVAIGGALLPAATKLINIFGPILTKIADWISNNKILALTIGGIVTGILTLNVALASLLPLMISISSIQFLAGFSNIGAVVASFSKLGFLSGNLLLSLKQLVQQPLLINTNVNNLKNSVTSLFGYVLKGIPAIISGLGGILTKIGAIALTLVKVLGYFALIAAKIALIGAAIATLIIKTYDWIAGTNHLENSLLRVVNLYDRLTGNEAVNVEFRAAGDIVGTGAWNKQEAAKTRLERERQRKEEEKAHQEYLRELDKKNAYEITKLQEAARVRESINSRELTALETKYNKELVSFQEYQNQKKKILFQEQRAREEIAERELTLAKAGGDKESILKAQANLTVLINKGKEEEIRLVRELEMEEARVHQQKLNQIREEGALRQEEVIRISEEKRKSLRKEVEALQNAATTASVVSTASITNKIQASVATDSNKDQITLLQKQIKNQDEQIKLARETIAALRDPEAVLGE
jgi:hypothetical protein